MPDLQGGETGTKTIKRPLLEGDSSNYKYRSGSPSVFPRRQSAGLTELYLRETCDCAFECIES